MTSPMDSGPDWPQQVTESIVNVVDKVKHQTTDRATMAVRGIVYGIAILLLGIPTLVMTLVALVHLGNFVATDLLGQGVWLVYLVLGVIFTIAGSVLWRKRVA